MVAQEDLIGIAKVDIPSNQLEALAIERVFDLPRANKKLGKCIKATADSDPTVRIKLDQ